MLELLVGEHAEHIGLVLGPVGGAMQFAVTVLVRDDAGVVAGHHGVEAEGDGALEQGRELDLFVAAHAGVGGSPGLIFGDEVVHDVFLEAFREVPHEEGNTQLGTDAACIHGVFEGAASAGAGAQGSGHAREGQVHTHDLVTRIDGAGRGHGGVNAAAHSCQNLHYAIPRFRGRIFPRGARRDVWPVMCWCRLHADALSAASDARARRSTGPGL